MNFMPISLDIETSGLNMEKCGIWQIGAVDLNNPENYFLQEGRVDDEDEVEEGALKVIEKTEKELRNKNSQTQKRLLENFLCQNPQFDVAFLEIKTRKYGLQIPFHYRSFNLHDYAQAKYFDLNKKFLIKEFHSDMGLANILKLCGMEDNRKAHNALEDARLTGECFYRLLLGKNIFPEYSKHKIPRVLLK